MPVLNSQRVNVNPTLRWYPHRSRRFRGAETNKEMAPLLRPFQNQCQLFLKASWYSENPLPLINGYQSINGAYNWHITGKGPWRQLDFHDCKVCIWPQSPQSIAHPGCHCMCFPQKKGIEQFFKENIEEKFRTRSGRTDCVTWKSDRLYGPWFNAGLLLNQGHPSTTLAGTCSSTIFFDAPCWDKAIGHEFLNDMVQSCAGQVTKKDFGTLNIPMTWAKNRW